MIPILYESTEVDFETEGLGRLSDCISCDVTEERNGQYECVFKYPINGKHYSEIQEGRIVTCTHDSSGDVQPFDIYARSAQIDGVVTFYARHVSYRLNHIILKPFEAVSCSEAINRMATETFNENPFSFWTDKNVAGNFIVDSPINVRNALGGMINSILDVYGKGEYEWDYWNVKLWLNRGVDRNVNIIYGINMIDYDQEYSLESVYNAVVPFFKNPDTGESVVLGGSGIVVSDNINKSAMPITTHAESNITDQSQNNIEIFKTDDLVVIPLDLSDKFNDAPTETQLWDAAKTALNAYAVLTPAENIEINFVYLRDTTEYAQYSELETVLLCDTVNVHFQQMGVTRVKMQVIKTDYNVLLDKYNRIELGDAKTTMSDAMHDMINNSTSGMATKENVSESVQNATQLITGNRGGYVMFSIGEDGKPEEIFIMDSTDKNTAVNVLRINNNGIGFSRDGILGPYRTAWTIDGSFVADFITSGTLDATLIRAGVLSDDLGYNAWDLINGILTTRNIIINGGSIDIDTGTSFLGFHVGRYGDVAIGEKPINMSDFDNNTCALQINNFGYIKLRNILFYSPENNGQNAQRVGSGSFVSYDIDNTNGIPAGVTFLDKNNGVLLNLSTSGIKMWNHVNAATDVEVGGYLTVRGTKNRIVKTKNYSDRLLYAYETASPMFGDIGEGTIGDYGSCYVWLDPIFAETISTAQYQVFLQAYGDGKCYVAKRHQSYFVVRGNAGMKFGWEIKAKQGDFPNKRLDINTDAVIQSTQDYGALAENHIESIKRGRGLN